MTDTAQVKVIPPLIPMALLTLGALAHWAWPVTLGPQALIVPLGLVVLLTSVVVVALALRELRRARTAFDIRKPTTSLVTTGVFAWSRNPSYLSLLLLCWSIGMLGNSLFVSLAAIPAGSALCLVVIRREEAYLGAKFGAKYRSYCQSVRRWL